MRILVFDTETTGLPKTKIINPDTLDKWPYVVQMSFIIYDSSLNDIIESKDYIIKIPESVIITEEISNINGITNQISKEKGIKINEVLNEFFYFLRNVDTLVGHNIEFDINMLRIELLRLINYGSMPELQRKYYKHDLHLLTHFKNVSCTLKDSVELCNIHSINKFGKPFLKYPKLIELHNKLFNTSPSHLHNSFNDILVTLRCYMKLKHNLDLMDDCNIFKKYSKQIGLD